MWSSSSLGSSRVGCTTWPSDAADELLRAIQRELEQNPERGSLVPGLAGVRKARIGNPGRGKGKRGGFRYLYLYWRTEQQIGLLYLLDKGEREDLSAAERKLLRELAARACNRR